MKNFFNLPASEIFLNLSGTMVLISFFIGGFTWDFGFVNAALMFAVWAALIGLYFKIEENDS